MATTDTSEQTLQEYRVMMFEEIGFSSEDAEKLSQAHRSVSVKSKNGFRNYDVRIDYHYVQKMLDNDATKDQVLRILL